MKNLINQYHNGKMIIWFWNKNQIDWRNNHIDWKKMSIIEALQQYKKTLL